jgi:hypothetical protein
MKDMEFYHEFEMGIMLLQAAYIDECTDKSMLKSPWLSGTIPSADRELREIYLERLLAGLNQETGFSEIK